MNENKTDTATIHCLNSEPYVYLEDGTQLAKWNKEDEILYNQQMRQKEKLKFYRHAFEFIKSHDLPGDYFEFGCHRVRTFRMALTEARKKNIFHMNFYAFDSFAGLPDCGNNLNHNYQYSAQLLSTSEQEFIATIRQHNLFINQVKTIKGFYQESLTPTLKAGLLNQGAKIALVTLDCSLYESFVSAFQFIEAFLQEGSVIYIDDYWVTFKGSPLQGVPRAFNEFKEKSAFGFEPYLPVGWFGKSFITYKK